MATTASGKYYLKTVHEEIALFDRKLAHLEKYEKFASDEEREQATRKMETKRNTLVKTAQRLVAEGTEFLPSELPKSLRPEGSEMEAPVEPAAAEAPAPVAGAMVSAGPRPIGNSPYAGTSLDWQASVKHYLAKKNRA